MGEQTTVDVTLRSAIPTHVGRLAARTRDRGCGLERFDATRGGGTTAAEPCPGNEPRVGNDFYK